jgi:hypothetical protein
MAHGGVTKNSLDRRKAREFGPAATLRLYKGAREPYTLVDTFTDGWFLRQLTDAQTGAEYYKLWVYDEDGDRRYRLRETTVFLIGRGYYKKLAPDMPVGSLQLWDIRVQPV